MKKVRNMFMALLLILVMVTCLTGCGKKEEEKSTRRERRERNEKNEDKETQDDDDNGFSIFGSADEGATSTPTLAPVIAAPATEITPAPVQDTPIPTEVTTPMPAQPVEYLAEFDTLDDLKFIRTDILGKNLKDVLDVLDNKYNFSIDRDSVNYVQNEQSSSVMYKLPVPGVSLLGRGGFTTLVLSYLESKTDNYDGFVINFELCLTGSDEKNPGIIPELAEITYSTLYSTIKSSLGDADFKDEFDTEDYGYYLWDNKTYGNIWLCGGHDVWGMTGYNDCLISFGLDESEYPSDKETEISKYFTVDEETGFFWMDTSIWNVSYKIFKTLLDTEEITELEEWPYWGHDLEAAFVKDGDKEYACIFQNGKLAQVYLEADEKMSSKIYEAAVAKYGNPYNAYMYWSGFPAYEWTVSDGYYQQHMEVYDETNHYRQQYVSPDYSE